jgi:hypothetical protein
MPTIKKLDQIIESKDYFGVLEQDGFETLEATIHDDWIYPTAVAIVDRIKQRLEPRISDRTPEYDNSEPDRFRAAFRALDKFNEVLFDKPNIHFCDLNDNEKNTYESIVFLCEHIAEVAALDIANVRARQLGQTTNEIVPRSDWDNDEAVGQSLLDVIRAERGLI